MLFLYDKKYMVALPVFRIYLVVDMIRFANITTILSGSGKTKTLMFISITTMICNAILNIVGFKLLGITGPALVTLALTLTMTFVLLHYGAKEIKSRVIDLFDFREIIFVGGQICIIGILAFFLSNVLREKLVSNVIILLVCYGGYIFILGLLNYRRALEYYRRLNQYK